MDLIEERQAAVEAILDAGHIPAGMELFKAGNESQLKTIYQWIDESDVYMLILGGRYGTVEPKSGKSYTQLEYEYACSKKILPYTTFNSKLPYADLCIKKRISHNSCGKPVLSFCNEASGIRTPDNLIKSQVLYRLS